MHHHTKPKIAVTDYSISGLTPVELAIKAIVHNSLWSSSRQHETCALEKSVNSLHGGIINKFVSESCLKHITCHGPNKPLACVELKLCHPESIDSSPGLQLKPTRADRLEKHLKEKVVWEVQSVICMSWKYELYALQGHLKL